MRGRESILVVFVGVVATVAADAATVEGLVLDAQMGRPLARTQVILQPIRGPSGIPDQRVFTDSLGRFSFLQLPAGAYTLRAERSGYAAANYGQKRWNGPGTPIVLGASGRFVGEIRLSKMGVVTGQVRDENRVGLPSYPVFAYRDGRPLRLVGNGISDDRGVYRIAGLEPGRYHVRTGPRQLEGGTELLPTYYGQTAAAEQSQPVDVRLDEETMEVNITPLPGNLFRLAGKVAFPGASSVSLYSDLGKNTAGVDGSGAFIFDQLGPGSYELLAEANVGNQPQVSHRKFWLGDDMEGLVLEPSRAPSLLVVCEADRSKTSDLRQLSMFLRRTAPLGEAGTQRLLCHETQFLSPGAREVAVLAPPQHYIASLSTDRGPLDGNQLHLQPAQRAVLYIVLSPNPASLRGRVLAEDGQPAIGAVVLLNPVDTALRPRLHGKNVTRADANGEYRLDSLPPGAYQVLGSLEYQDADEVDWSAQQSATVRLEEGRQAVLDLTLR